jgi:hypothetical protein
MCARLRCGRLFDSLGNGAKRAAPDSSELLIAPIEDCRSPVSAVAVIVNSASLKGTHRYPPFGSRLTIAPTCEAKPQKTKGKQRE